ncbi:ShlB/FhaC/HecB family hemolysin secretion/activation protein [Flavobacterium luminosum]|uniref:Haemolysin activator HlyB C-terminal domain-containing protein n=1 Tax=Flavobacterium luminosum TaxID=2949086 RepID=A0ABT0TPG5_9FLAO|nr:ShlB/FhaC/HecB family hemolysin secretion/activation protein [Flavobacterium sp. HXWNR70]MCL9809176.1 hypothetical protein [Flavobacterium sp. HXWNR70]
MSLRFLILFFLLYIQNSFGQQFYLTISSDNQDENKIIDSISYQKKHSSVKSILEEEKNFKKKIETIGFFEAQFENIKKINDSIFLTKTFLNSQIKQTYIYINKKDQAEYPWVIFNTLKDTVKINTKDVENYLESLLTQYEKKGYPLTKLKLINQKQEKNILQAQLEINREQNRKMDLIVINGYDKFPKNHLTNLKRQYKRKTYNQENLQKLYNEINKLSFVKQTKFPEILFTNDSTKIFVYAEKNKPNTFDGFLGFTNDKQKKLSLSGYLDLQLENLLNSGEKIKIFWKSDGNNQKTFDSTLELPYLMQSRIGLKAQLNIFKQDSTYQNTLTNINLGYYFKHNARLFVGYQETESSNILNINNNQISDFTNYFLTTNFEYFDTDDNILFPKKTFFYTKIGTGKRTGTQYKNNQFFFSTEISHNFYLNRKNIFFLRNQNQYLESNQYLTNELFRFGGLNSIRGFNENSLQGNLFSSIQTEYRYIPTPNLYLYTITDYGYLQDKTTQQNSNLLGIGIGFGLLTKNGLFNVALTNGSTKNQNIKLNNSIIQLNFKNNF